MKDRERYTENKAVRLTKTQVNKLEKLDITIREAVEFCIDRKENPKLKLLDRKRDIERDIKDLEFKLKQLKEELDEINKELGTTKELEETLSLDNILDGNKIIDGFKTWKGGKSLTIEQYFMNKQFKRMLNHCKIEHGGENPDEYENQLINYIRANAEKQ